MRSIICDWCDEEYFDPADKVWKCDNEECPHIEKSDIQNKNFMS